MITLLIHQTTQYYNINIITHYRKTQHKHNTDEEIQGLKNRMKIEEAHK